MVDPEEPTAGEGQVHLLSIERQFEGWKEGHLTNTSGMGGQRGRVTSPRDAARVTEMIVLVLQLRGVWPWRHKIRWLPLAAVPPVYSDVIVVCVCLEGVSVCVCVCVCVGPARLRKVWA